MGQKSVTRLSENPNLAPHLGRSTHSCTHEGVRECARARVAARACVRARVALPEFGPGTLLRPEGKRAPATVALCVHPHADTRMGVGGSIPEKAESWTEPEAKAAGYTDEQITAYRAEHKRAGVSISDQVAKEKAAGAAHMSHTSAAATAKSKTNQPTDAKVGGAVSTTKVDESHLGVNDEPEPSEGEFTVFGDIKELEVIVRICGYLSSPKDLGHLACVSRGFGNKVLWSSEGACEQLGSMRSVVEESARRWVLARWTHLDEDCTAEGQSWLRQMQNVRLATRFDAKRNAGIGLFEDVPQEVRWPARGAAKTPGLLRTVFMKMKANESTVPFRADNVDGIANWVWKHAKDQTGQKQLSETSGFGSEKRAVAKIAEQIRSLPPAKSIAKVVQDVEQEESSRPGGVVAHRHLNSKTAALPCCGSAVLPTGGRYFAEFTTLGAVFVGVVPADYVYKGLLHKCHQEDGH
eukprot:COSAG02_NODE_3107_length_7352_cov_61.084930_6_plen_465_part_01